MKYVRNCSHGAARSPSSSTTYFSSICSRSCLQDPDPGRRGPPVLGTAARAACPEFGIEDGSMVTVNFPSYGSGHPPHTGRGVAARRGACQPWADMIRPVGWTPGGRTRAMGRTRNAAARARGPEPDDRNAGEAALPDGARPVGRCTMQGLPGHSTQRDLPHAGHAVSRTGRRTPARTRPRPRRSSARAATSTSTSPCDARRPATHRGVTGRRASHRASSALPRPRASCRSRPGPRPARRRSGPRGPCRRP